MAVNLPELYKLGGEAIITPLNGAISAVSTTIPVLDVSVLAPAPNIAVIFDRTGERAELIRYGGINGNALTDVTRGYQGRTGVFSWQPYTDEHGRKRVNITNAISSAHIDGLTDAVFDLAELIETLGDLSDLENITNIVADIKDIKKTLNLIIDDAGIIGGDTGTTNPFPPFIGG